jgi:hypothetical protein
VAIVGDSGLADRLESHLLAFLDLVEPTRARRPIG